MCAVAGAAPAAPKVVSGGPGADAERAALTRALADAAGLLGVCWRGDRPETVEVELSIAADGEVASARPKARGKVAACAAAVLAVQTLPPARKPYKVTVSFPTRGGDDRELIMEGVRGDAAVRACYADVAGLRGEVRLRFLVKPDGRIVDVEVARSTLSDDGVQRCLVKALSAVRVGALQTRKTIEFVLPLTFDGGGAGQAAKGDAALTPQKKGPLEAEVLTSVMNEARPRFSACYERRLREAPELAGDVVLRYTVRDDGKAYNVKIKQTTLGDAAVEACIVRVGESLRFPKSKGRKDTRVVYPFRFARP